MMFVYFNDDDTIVAIARDAILAVYNGWIYFKPDYNEILGAKMLLTDRQYCEVIKQLQFEDFQITIEPTPPVGEPLREIVGEAWESKEGG